MNGYYDEPARRIGVTVVCPDYQRTAHILKDQYGMFCDACGAPTPEDGAHRRG